MTVEKTYYCDRCGDQYDHEDIPERRLQVVQDIGLPDEPDMCHECVDEFGTWWYDGQ